MKSTKKRNIKKNMSKQKFPNNASPSEIYRKDRKH